MLFSFFLIITYYNYSGVCSMDFKDGLTSKDWSVRMIIGIILLGEKKDMSCLSKIGLRPRGFKPIEWTSLFNCLSENRLFPSQHCNNIYWNSWFRDVIFKCTGMCWDLLFLKSCKQWLKCSWNYLLLRSDVRQTLRIFNYKHLPCKCQSSGHKYPALDVRSLPFFFINSFNMSIFQCADICLSIVGHYVRQCIGVNHAIGSCHLCSPGMTEVTGTGRMTQGSKQRLPTGKHCDGKSTIYKFIAYLWIFSCKCSYYRGMGPSESCFIARG
jgi:hypothetical protein